MTDADDVARERTPEEIARSVTAPWLYVNNHAGLTLLVASAIEAERAALTAANQRIKELEACVIHGAIRALAGQAPAGDGWRPMEDVPLNTPVEVRMPYTKGGWWVATAEVDEVPEPYDDAGDRWASILHYNGTTLVGLFRGPLHSWRPLPAPPVVEPGREVA